MAVLQTIALKISKILSLNHKQQVQIGVLGINYNNSFIPIHELSYLL